MMKTRILTATFLAVISSALGASSGPSAVDVVTQLYRQFAWEAMIEAPQAPDHDLLEQPRAVLSQYFDDQLTGLILRDRQCAATSHEVCRLDFSPIWASQDPAATGLSIVGGADPEVVNVTFRDPRDRKLTHLSFHVRKGRTGWRIADIRYSSGPSLLTILQSTP